MGRKTKITVIMENLINLLDEQKDRYLIAILNNKMIEFIEDRKQELLDINSVTDKQKMFAKHGLTEKIRHMEFTTPHWYKRIQKIRYNYTDCEKCNFRPKKLGIDEYGDTIYEDKTFYSRCRRCDNWDNRLSRILNNFDREQKQIIHNEILTDEVLVIKAIIIKLQKKIAEATFTWIR